MNKRSSPSFRQRRHDATAQLLISAAEAVMARRGYENATMRDIAAEAGCAPGTLYIYFRRKQQVVDAITERHSQLVLDLLDAALAAATDPLEKLRIPIRVMTRHVHDHRESYRIIRGAMRAKAVSLPAGMPAGVRSAWQAYWGRELAVIREAQARGQVRTDFPPETLQRFLQVTVTALLDELSHAARMPDPEESLRMVWAFVLDGMGGKPPAKARQRRPGGATRSATQLEERRTSNVERRTSK